MGIYHQFSAVKSAIFQAIEDFKTKKLALTAFFGRTEELVDNFWCLSSCCYLIYSHEVQEGTG